MVRTLFFVFISFLANDILGQEKSVKQLFPHSFVVTVSNPIDVDRENEMIVVPETQLVNGFNSKAFVVMDGSNEIPSQYNHHDKDFPGIVFVLDKLAANAQRKIVVRYNPSGVISRNYTKRTQAELSHKVNGQFINREYVGGEFKNVDFLRVPAEHKDHSWFIRYEGPGWESDKVGYRFYLDQRNATDVFGKKASDMVLQHIGLDGFDSYHHMQSWGMDVMKVGKSLGLGTPGMYKTIKFPGLKIRIVWIVASLKTARCSHQ